MTRKHPASGDRLDIPLDLKVRWRICRNCDHTEVQHAINGTRCYLRRDGANCQCSGYAPWEASGEHPFQPEKLRAVK